jgi:ABC-type polysaccharide/polyol phosphate transport system ATPase subunit
MSTAIKVENLSKIYRLGEIGTGTISRDIERYIKTRILKQEDPFLKIGETNNRAEKGSSDIVYSLKDINFEIEQGSAVGIIGRNGAGKSTLLKILSRVTSPTTGKINISGRVASLLEVGTGFHPELTGRENIYLNGAILGMRKREIDRKFDEIVDFSGVERYIDTPVKRYSSGMYVRLAFAVAAHLESEILIVDEVLAVGDAEFQKKCLGKMGEVSKTGGRTVLFVSHNLASIKTLCTQGIYMKNGMVESVGNVNEVLSSYKQSSQGIFELNGFTELSKRINRCASEGTVAGNVRFTSIKFMDNELEENVVFTKDSDILMEIEYKVFEDIENLGLVVQFESADTFEVVTSNFFVLSQDSLNKGKEGKLLVKFQNLPVQTGDYFPYLVACNLSRIPYDVIDRLIINVPVLEIQKKVEGFAKHIEIPSELTVVY